MNRKEHLLVCATEEGIEVALALAQRLSKGLRFGLDEVQEGQAKTNAQRIVAEYHDLTAVLIKLAEEGHIELKEEELDAAVEAKHAKLEKFMEYAEKCGTLEKGSYILNVEPAMKKERCYGPNHIARNGVWGCGYHEGDPKHDDSCQALKPIHEDGPCNCSASNPIRLRRDK